MKRFSLQILAIVLIVGGTAAWFKDPSRKIDWIPLFVVGIAVFAIDARISDLEKRLEQVSK